MPPVYAVISFFSYRYFRDYTYYDLIETGVYREIPQHAHPCTYQPVPQHTNQ